MAKQEKQKQVLEPEWTWELASIRCQQIFKYTCPWDNEHGEKKKGWAAWKEFDTIDGLIDHLKTAHNVTMNEDMRKTIEDFAKAGVRALKNVYYSIQQFQDDGPIRGLLVTEMLQKRR